MANVSTWSKTAASNNSTPPDGWPENQAPSTVNDCAREMMAALRTQFENSEWFNYGDTVSYNSSTIFKVTGDQTARYASNARVKAFATATIYGTVVSSSYTTETTVTINTDSGSLTSSLSSVAVGILSPTNVSYPHAFVRQNGTPIYAAATGTTNSFAVSLSPKPLEYTSGLAVNFKANTANIAAATLDVNGLGAKALKKTVNGATSDLSSSDILASQMVHAIYDGTNFQMLSPVAPVKTSVLVLQKIFAAIAGTSGTTSFPTDNTTPVVTDGTQIVSQAITLASSSSRVTIQAGFTAYNATNSQMFVAVLFRGSTCLATVYGNQAGEAGYCGFNIIDSPATSGSVTYTIRAGRLTTGTWYVNQNNAGSYHNGTLATQGLILEELSS